MKFVNKALLLILMGVSCVCFPQPKDYKLLTGDAKADIEKKIVTASRKISSLQCKFEQEKSSVLLVEKAVAKGILLYKAPGSLRWEYTEPNKYTLIFHEENAYIKDEKGTIVNSNKMLKQLGDFIVSTINGNSLVENGNFKIDYYENEKNKNIIWVRLTPIPKKLKEMYSSIQIKISVSDYLASEIIMEEKSGDKTSITLFDKKINTDIPANRFSVQ